MSAGRRHDAAGLRRAGRRRDPARRRRQPAHRLRLRHRGHHGRQRRPAGGRGGAAPGRRLHPHLLHGHALRGVRRGLREAGRADAGQPREALRALQLRRRGGGERGQGRAPPHRTRRDRRVRPRLPRAHEPDDGADREDHALQARLRTVRRRDLPRPDGLPLPLAGRRRGLRRRGVRRLRRVRAHPGRARTAAPPSSSSRSRARAASSCPPPGLAAAGRRLVPRARHPADRRRDPDRLRRARATGSPATTRASCPTWSRRPRAWPAACRWPP